ncbi:RCC1 domain-containing protein [Paenibacillus sp. GYB003]|uniref:RCC1 domain-containing protein n=1 Tax=Paenibacillus sp. GYB003 TaxID=2994392 RepID=UPI002F96DE9D
MIRFAAVLKTVRFRVFAWVAVLMVASGTFAYAESPTNGTTPQPKLYISADGVHNIAYNEQGDVWYWGGMGDFEFPDWKLRDNTPIRMGTMKHIAQVSSNLFLKKDGTVWTWSAGPAPVGGSDRRLQFQIQDPVQLDLADVVKVAAGDSFHSAVKKDGSVWVWRPVPHGYGDTPVQIPNISDAADIAFANWSRQSKLTIVGKDGSVWTWEGATAFGGIAPVKAKRVDGLSDVASVFAGDECFFAIRKDGSVWGWGSNLRGQLGLDEQKIVESPVRLSALDGMVAIQGSFDRSLGLKKDGTVWSWGITLDKFPEYGAKIDPNLHQVAGLDNIAAIASGGAHHLAIRSDGTLWAWGSNENGQLGDGTFRSSDKPIRIDLK